MATIRASCDHCGDVEMTSADLEVRVCTSDNSGTYSFECPSCSRVVVRSAEARTIDLLVASGAPYATWEVPAELSEPRGRGAAISHDELLDFHEFLADEQMVAEALLELARD